MPDPVLVRPLVAPVTLGDTVRVVPSATLTVPARSKMGMPAPIPESPVAVMLSKLMDVAVSKLNVPVVSTRLPRAPALALFALSVLPAVTVRVVEGELIAVVKVVVSPCRMRLLMALTTLLPPTLKGTVPALMPVPPLLWESLVVMVNSWPAGALSTGVTPWAARLTVAAFATTPIELTVPVVRVSVLPVAMVPSRFTVPPETVTLRATLPLAPTPKMAPAGMLVVEAAVPSEPLIWRVPVPSDVLPVWVRAPLRVSVPTPAFVNAPLPEILPSNCAATAVFTVRVPPVRLTMLPTGPLSGPMVLVPLFSKVVAALRVTGDEAERLPGLT